MADLTADVLHDNRPNAGKDSFVVLNGKTLYAGALVGVDLNGFLTSWANVATNEFQGILLEGAVGDTTASPPVEGRVDTSGPILRSATVASAVQGNVNDPVYSLTDNPADLTLTPGLTTSVGYIRRFISAGVCDVVLYTPTAAQTAAEMSGITSLTDSTGDSGTHDDTLAAITESAAITDNSGGTDPGDDTIAAVTNVDTLTDSTGGTADNTVGPVVPVTDASMVAIGGSGMTTAQEAEYNAAMAEINTAVGVINNNFKELTDQVITQGTANTAVLAAIAQLAAKANVTQTAVGVLKQNESDLAQKINEILATG